MKKFIVGLGLNKLRDEAVKKTWESGGIELIRKLANQVSFGGFVSFHLVRSIDDENVFIKLLEVTNQGTDKEKFFARCLSGSAYEKFGSTWTQLLISKSKGLGWSPDEIVNALINFPDSNETFDLLESLGGEVDRVYWVNRPRWFRSKDDTIVVRAIKKLKDNGRAIDALVLAAQSWKTKDPVAVFGLLDQAIEELYLGKEERRLGDDAYWLKELFKSLRGQESIDKSELARREYAYLPLLTGSMRKTDLALHEILSSEPDFFMCVLRDLYRPASDTADDYQPSTQERLRAEFAWKLLNSWKQPPGVEKNGDVRDDKLREWLKEARQLAAKADLPDVADSEIGKVLFYFPNDPDDSLWPHVELRNVIEALQSEKIERGIELEQVNSRGVVTKNPFEGGAQERQLAQKWRNMAEKLGRWPRTRAMFERIASYWETDAQEEDHRAEKRRLQSS